MRTAKTDQIGGMPRLIWVFTGCNAILLVLSWGGSDAGCTCWSESLLGTYHNDSKILDRQDLANYIDPVQAAPSGQTEGAVWSGSTLFAILDLFALDALPYSKAT